MGYDEVPFLKDLKTAIEALETVLGEVEETPTTYTLLSRLKAVATSLSGLTFTGEDLQVKTYAFSIGGVNFNDYTKIKTLWLPSNANQLSHVNLKSGATNYQVPAGYAFIGLKLTGYIFDGAGQVLARFGEASTEGGDIDQEVLSFSDGTVKAFMKDCLGVFAAEKWIKAATFHNTVSLYANSALYGVEVPV